MIDDDSTNDYADEIAERELHDAYLERVRTTNDPQEQLHYSSESDIDGLLALIGNPFVTDTALKAISTSHIAVEMTLLGHPRCPEQVLEAAVLSDIPEVRELAFKHPANTKIGRQWGLMEANNPQPDPRNAFGPTTSEVFFDRAPGADQRYLDYVLDADSPADELIYEGVACLHPMAPEWMLERVLTKIMGHMGLTRSIKLGDAHGTTHELAADSAAYRSLAVLLRDLALNPQSSTRMLLEIAKSEDAFVLESLVRNPRTPVPNLKQVVGRNDHRLLVAVAQHPSKSIADLLGALAERRHPEIDLYLAANSNLPEYLLERYFDTSEVPLQLALVANKALYPEQIHELLARFGRHVRASAASNPSADDALLRSLAVDPDPHTRVAVAGNISTPSEILIEYFVKDPDRSVRRSAAMNSVAPLEILAVFATDLYPSSWVARQANLPVEVQEKIVRSGKPIAKYWLAANPNAAKEVLDKIAGSDHPEVLLQLTHNPSTPRDTLERLQYSRFQSINIAATIANL